MIKLKSVEEVVAMFGAVEGKAIKVLGGGSISIEVIPHASLVCRARNQQSS